MENVILVVEGKNDYSRIKQIYPNLDILITGGSAISEKFLSDLKELAKTNKIVVFTDPDFPGEKIRKTIQEHVPNSEHVFINKQKAISRNNKKVGVEHASKNDIISALEHVHSSKASSDITFDFLYDLNLIGDNKSKEKRLYLCDKLNIGYVNAKQLEKRLVLFGFTKKDILEALDDWQY